MLNILHSAKQGLKAPSDPTGNREKLKREVKSHHRLGVTQIRGKKAQKSIRQR